MGALKHQAQPGIIPVTSDGLRRNQLALEAMIAAASAAGVTTFNTRAGAVTLVLEDVRQALGVTYATNGLKVLRVNAAETGFELGAPSTGTVTSVSITTANGVTGSVLNPTTAPAITLTLGAITPTTVTASGAISGSNLSGTNTGDQNLAPYATTAAVVAGYQPLDTQLTDVAALVYAGNALKVIRVNAGATAFELATVSGGASGYTYATTAISLTETATSGEKITTATASGLTITLPTAVGNTAKLTYKLMVAGTLIIDGNAAETIDDGLTATLNRQYESITIISTNANWVVI